METFKASTQYGDWKGSASADHSDATTLADLLLERELRTRDEFLAGVELYIGENHNNSLGYTRVVAYLVDGAGFDNALQAIEQAGPALKLKKVDVDLKLEEFLGLFKRFSVTLSNPRLGLEGREFSTD
ncbi:hypothetical protein BCO18175_07405 [Burkholderia contaminans]|uniref:hypothetical protein n=1 Tax=Burkholderia contaminans TaxID=488447 RepID=UPI001453AA47|nr:hypothetical protein [Burkholderia contaminans]VWD48196.1 hypothetical protein BCO18175_07405 [Burkholderia contaminans]